MILIVSCSTLTIFCLFFLHYSLCVLCLCCLSIFIFFPPSSLSKLKNPKRSENVEVMESNNEGKHQLLSSKKNKNRNESFVNGSADVDCDAQGKKQNVSKGKSKKAKKLERMALMGKGLDSVTFSNVSDTILNGMEPDDESMEEDSSNDSSNFNGHLLSKEKFPSKRKSKHSQSDDSQKIKKKKKVL